MNNHKRVKILQTNVDRRRAAHDVAYAAVIREKIDIQVVCEPNRKIADPNKGWLVDMLGNVAVRLHDKGIQVERVKPMRGYIIITVSGGLSICAGYISPNVTLISYRQTLDEMMEALRDTRGDFLLMGDFNAKAEEWGSPISDARGAAVCEWVSTLDLVVHNEGILPTCVTPNGQSYIDLTISTQRMATRVHNWVVSEEITMSTHKHILFHVTLNQKGGITAAGRQVLNLDRNRLSTLLNLELGELMETQSPVTVNSLETVLLRTQKMATNNRGNGRPLVPYWWTPEVEVARNACVTLRRTLLRAGRRRTTEHIVERTEEYKQARNAYRREIRRAKKASWTKLCADLERDIWGDGYKIAVRHLKGMTPGFSLTEERRKELILELFPPRSDNWEEIPPTEEVPPLTLEEVITATSRLRVGTAPGDDAIIPMMVKLCVEPQPEVIRQILESF